MKTLILHDRILDNSRPDEIDTLEEIEAIEAALDELGIAHARAEFASDLAAMQRIIGDSDVDFVFNMVESVDGRGMLIALAPLLFDLAGMSYTGNSADAMYITSNKIVAKRIMDAAGIPTAPWFVCGAEPERGTGERYIVKSAWEHASIGIDASSVFTFTDARIARAAFAAKREALGGLMFAERFISGREFNISLLHGACGMQVLHPAEMTWDGAAAGERMMGYSAKWTEGAEDYDCTRRTFSFTSADEPLLAELARLCGECARVFGLSGYARVDFRVDESGQPWVLEINANPCLSPESGIAAAARHVGIAYPELIQRIVDSRVLR